MTAGMIQSDLLPSLSSLLSQLCSPDNMTRATAEDALDKLSTENTVNLLQGLSLLLTNETDVQVG